MIKILLALFLGAFGTLCSLGSARASTDFLKKCGGEIYPACDSAELNQMHVFEEARLDAKKSGRQLLVLLGADWCPPCRDLDRLLEIHSEDRLAIEKKYKIVRLAASIQEKQPHEEVSPRLQSIDRVAQKMGIQIDLFPWFYVVDVRSGKATDDFCGVDRTPSEIRENLLLVEWRGFLRELFGCNISQPKPNQKSQSRNKKV